MILILATAESPFDFVPGEMDYRRPSVDVVRGKRGVAQRGEERAHLACRKLLTGFYRCLAGYGRRQTLMLSGRAGHTIPRQGV